MNQCIKLSTSFAIFIFLSLKISLSSPLVWFGLKPASHYNYNNRAHIINTFRVNNRQYDMHPAREPCFDSNPPSKESKGVIYITVGPQCAGKTTLLTKSIDSVEVASTDSLPVMDISIDDQDGVYLKIPSRYFLTNSAPSKLSEQADELLQIVHNKSISERIYDATNDEMRWIAQRLCNQMTKDELGSRIMALDSTQSVWQSVLQTDGDEPMRNGTRTYSQPVDWRICLLEVVEEYVFSDSDEIFETVDLFVVESIFKTPNTNMSIRRNGDLDSFFWPPSIAKRALSGLAMASMKLKYLAKKEIETPLAWGNTNAVR